MDDEATFADLLYVGPIYVEVGYCMGMPRAKTASAVLGSTDLGGEISVELPEYAFGDEEEGAPPYGSVEMWKMLLTQMRAMLARCMVFGEIDPLWDGPTEEGHKEFSQATDELGDDFFEITPAVALEALRARARADEASMRALEQLGEFMEAQQSHPDENITLSEAMKRREEGAAKVRKIVEGVDEA